MDRYLINKLKTELQVRVNYLTKVYESVETDDHYDCFIQMCGTHLEFANFWQRKLRRQIVSLRPIKNYKLYKDYVEYAKYTCSIIQCHIDEYTAAVKQAVEDQELFESTRKRLEMEFQISSALNDAKLEELRSSDVIHVTGFAQGGPKKRKYTKKNNGDK